MAAVESHVGLLQQSLERFERYKFINISNTKQHYSIMPMLTKQYKSMYDQGFKFGADVQYESTGRQFVQNVQVNANSSFQTMDMSDPLNVNPEDHQLQSKFPVRIFSVNYPMNKVEKIANTTPEQITDMFISRRVGAKQALADGLETQGWSKPSSSSDVQSMWGIPYWLFTQTEASSGAYSGNFASANDGGFLNENLTAFPNGPGGISRVTYPQWGNWNNQYTSPGTGGFDDATIRKIAIAIVSTGFTYPYDFPDAQKGPPMLAIYSTKRNWLLKGEKARQNNDANTSNLMARTVEADVFTVPWMWLPHLDTALFGAETSVTHRIYGINWNQAYFAVASGMDLTEEVFAPDISHPLSTVYAMFLEGNMCFQNPRSCFVLSQ